MRSEQKLELKESQEANLQQKKRSICIVGGGPVGLWLALSVKLLQEGSSVTVFEKRETYQRSHALRIGTFSFEGMTRHDVLKDLAEQFVPRTRTSFVEGKISLLHCVV